MAESIVNFVLGKLSNVVVKEILLQYGIDEQVEAVRRELGRIQAFLKDADKKQITDETQKHWVKEVRDVAYSIEDVIDIFLMEVHDKTPQKSGKMAQICCLLQAVKKVITRTKKIPAVHKLVKEIGQIQTRMKEIEESKDRFGIKNLGEGTEEIRQPVRRPVLPDIDPDIVGFKEDQVHLVKKLLDETNKRCSVVSIWGSGGGGKTTLARKIYNCNDVKEQFGLRIWVVISKTFKVIDVLRNIAQQFHPPIKLSEEAKEEAFLTEIRKSLQDKKYLIVLDDVWTTDLWTQIGEAFPDEKNGSRVLITTRNFNVAKDADPTGDPYEPMLLTEEISRELLLKIVFPNQDPNKNSFDDLSDILDQFIHKCGGLPLALVVLGGLLSTKPRDYTVWTKIFRTMSWHVEGKNCSEIIGASFEDLPFALKSCFMYFAAFPEDYEIHAPSLLRMWIAEGFIAQEDNKTLEETAESFLEDLVQRSMVQVRYRSFDGSIVSCCIHDVLRDLALEKAKEDNFIEVYSHPDDQTRLSKARRVAIHNSNCGELLTSQNLRTLLCFHGIRMPNCSKQKLLKVVSISEDDEENKIEVGMFEGLTQLRYLGLDGMLSDEWNECFEKVIGSMMALQTLDVSRLRTTDGAEKFHLPDCAWHIKTLRHVIFPESHDGTSRPPPSAMLTNLQTITSMHIRDSWETELVPHLPNLRTLKLVHKSFSWKVVVTFLATLKHLISLEILGCRVPSDILDMRPFPFYHHLQYLVLLAMDMPNPNEMVLHENMLPRHLTYLGISNYKFEQDPMPILEKLRCLKNLVLDNACNNRKMSCSSGGFNQLENLWLVWLDTEEWEIEEDAMPILNELYISECYKLGVPQGLQNLTNLQKLTWRGCRDNDKANLVRNLCKHVPSVDIW